MKERPRKASGKPAAKRRASTPRADGVAAAIISAELHVSGDLGAAPAASVEAPVELTSVRIGYFNPEAREVFAAGTFNDWDRRATPLQRDELGDWSIHLQLPAGEYRYRLIVDGEWRDDPCARRTVPNPFGSVDAVIDV